MTTDLSPPAQHNNEEPEVKEPSYEDLLAKITHPKQRAFLENYHIFGEITATAVAIGMTRVSVWNWQQQADGVFLVAFNALKKEYDAHLLLQHERNLDNIAFDSASDDRSRVLASIFITKALAPDKYRDKVTALPFTGSIHIELSVPRPGMPVKIETKEPKQLKEGGQGDKAD